MQKKDQIITVCGTLIIVAVTIVVISGLLWVAAAIISNMPMPR